MCHDKQHQAIEEMLSALYSEWSAVNRGIKKDQAFQRKYKRTIGLQASKVAYLEGVIADLKNQLRKSRKEDRDRPYCSDGTHRDALQITPERPMGLEIIDEITVRAYWKCQRCGKEQTTLQPNPNSAWVAMVAGMKS